MTADIAWRLLKALPVTIEIAILSMVLATVFSVIAGLGRLARNPALRLLVLAYVEVFRGTSLLVQLFWLFFVLPYFGILLNATVVGVLGIALDAGAYGAETVRGAVLAIPRGQREAAIALNMSPQLRMRRIIFPQAVLMLLPSWGNMLIDILKSTSIVSLITIHDLTFVAYNLNAQTFRTIEIFSMTLVIYFVLSQMLAAGVRAVERRLRRAIPTGAL